MPERPENEILQTRCTECDSTFNLNLSQLLAADGRVRCSQCNDVFDANIYLVRETDENTESESETISYSEPDILDELAEEVETVSLADAMHGDGDKLGNTKNWTHAAWFFAILLFIAIGLAQWVYFDRLELIKNPKHQNIILSLCSIIPCDSAQFKSNSQFTLIERNIFTHPTRPNALLISGSFVNEAPFTQKMPALNIRLFNLKGDIIAQRLFSPDEYQQNKPLIEKIAPGESIHFKLEVKDPDTVTITYEFDFL